MYAGVGKQGRDMGGLTAYLFGPGKANEHTNPHVVASGKGDMFLAAWGGNLSASEARALGHAVEAQFNTMRRMNQQREHVMPGAGSLGGAGLYGIDRDTSEREHVFHAHLSLRADEGTLSDEKWHAIAHDYMREMCGDQAEKMDWVAVRHGLSEAGNDHIHLAVSLVDSDHQYADTWQSFNRSKNAARVLEQRHGLNRMSVRDGDRAAGNYQRAEREANPGVSRGMLPSAQLQRIVRSSAMMAANESQFLRLLNEKGVSFAPRWQAGGSEKVVGYSVKLRSDEHMIWRGGGKLARDLTLSKLRERWDQSPQDEAKALRDWTRVEQPQPRTNLERVDADQAVRDAVRFTSEWQKELATIPVSDDLEWKREAGRLSGVFGQLGQHHEGRLGADMRWMARRYERLAQNDHAPVQRGHGHAELAAQQMDLALSASVAMNPSSVGVLYDSMVQTAVVVERANAAQRELIDATARCEHAEAKARESAERLDRVRREVAAWTRVERPARREQLAQLPPETYRAADPGRDYGR